MAFQKEQKKHTLFAFDGACVCSPRVLPCLAIGQSAELFQILHDDEAITRGPTAAGGRWTRSTRDSGHSQSRLGEAEARGPGFYGSKEAVRRGVGGEDDDSRARRLVESDS